MLKNIFRAFTQSTPRARIAFDRGGDYIPGYPHGIFTINADGSDCRHIKNIGTYPRWSPDGQWIAYLEKVQDNSFLNSIFLMRPDGQQARRLTHDYDVDASYHWWSPDSRHLVYELWLWEEK